MSLEAALAANTAALETFTAAIVTQTDVQRQILEIQQRLAAGQKEVIEKVEAAAKPVARRRSNKDESTTAPEAAAEKPKGEEKPKADAPEFALVAKAWMDAVNPRIAGDKADADAYKVRGTTVRSILDNFGATKLIDITDAEQKKQALFYVLRAKEGLKIDFSADYDFDGDPTQGGADEEAFDDM